MDGAGRTTDSAAGGAGIGLAIPPACEAETAAAAAAGTAITTVASVASGSVAGSASASSAGASGSPRLARLTGLGPGGAGQPGGRGSGGRPPTAGPIAVLERSLVLGHAREHRQPRRRGQRPGGPVGRHDREALLVDQRVPGEEPEVDPRRRHLRAVRQHEHDPAPLGSPDARRGRRDLVVDVDVEDAVGHR